MSGNPRCELCPKPQRAAVVVARVPDVLRKRTRLQNLCRMHLTEAVAGAGRQGLTVQILEWLNEVAQRQWEEDELLRRHGD